MKEKSIRGGGCSKKNNCVFNLLFICLDILGFIIIVTQHFFVPYTPQKYSCKAKFPY